MPLDTAGALLEPRAVAVHPTRPAELYIADASRSAIVVANTSAVGAASARVLKDRAQYHYMARVSSLAFDGLGQYATCQESTNDYEGTMLPNFFMGPTLYDSRLSYVNSRQRRCEPGETCFLLHIDMLHESPYCMGIAHDGGAPAYSNALATYRNVYWAFDGGHSQLVRYDFRSDHGPGDMDHSVAEVRRYTGLRLSRKAGVPSHMVVDSFSRTLYVADTGSDRVVSVAIDSGRYARDAKLSYPIFSSPEASFNYTEWDGLRYEVIASVPTPSGLALSGSTLYIGSYSTGIVHAVHTGTGALAQVAALAPPGALLGLAVGVAGGGPPALWYINGAERRVMRVEVERGCGGERLASTECADGQRNGEETDVDCGGRLCARCNLGEACAKDSDCASDRCVFPGGASGGASGGAPRGACGAEERVEHASTFLLSYLNSAFYNASFAHHMLHGDMGGASYRNPYPIMDDDFCATVGIRNGSLDCALIDRDSLLLGGCWCHACLPENPCVHNGTCVNFKGQGYSCDCAATGGYTGDHCQYPPGEAAAADFPFYVRELPQSAAPAGGTALPASALGRGADAGPSNALIAGAVGGGIGGAALLVTLVAMYRRRLAGYGVPPAERKAHPAQANPAVTIKYAANGDAEGDDGGRRSRVAC